MLGVYVSIPIACFRNGYAREYLETDRCPPPSTCYGFLLALVGECRRERHSGCRVSITLLRPAPISTVLRTVWRFKKRDLGASGNARPDYQQLLSDVHVLIWIESQSEPRQRGASLEERVQTALNNPNQICRFGGLSLGESTHLINDAWILDARRLDKLSQFRKSATTFVTSANGTYTVPVWVDHVGSQGTRFVSGDFEHMEFSPPLPDRMPVILP